MAALWCMDKFSDDRHSEELTVQQHIVHDNIVFTCLNGEDKEVVAGTAMRRLLMTSGIMEHPLNTIR